MANTYCYFFLMVILVGSYYYGIENSFSLMIFVSYMSQDIGKTIKELKRSLQCTYFIEIFLIVAFQTQDAKSRIEVCENHDWFMQGLIN